MPTPCRQNTFIASKTRCQTLLSGSMYLFGAFFDYFRKNLQFFLFCNNNALIAILYFPLLWICNTLPIFTGPPMRRLKIMKSADLFPIRCPPQFPISTKMTPSLTRISIMLRLHASLLSDSSNTQPIIVYLFHSHFLCLSQNSKIRWSLTPGLTSPTYIFNPLRIA